MKHVAAYAACLLAFALQQAAADGPASAPITLTLEQAPLTDALRQIEEASGLNMAFAPELVRDAAPVTLRVVNEPAGEVLYRLLRERGLVPVYTADTMAAVVGEESAIGMAKRAGRALHVLAALIRKLEGAVSDGDGARVPGWTEADDRALAEALIDMDTFRRHLKLQFSRPSKPSLDEITQMADIHDAHVKAGGGVLFGQTWWFGDKAAFEESHHFNANRLRLIRDDDPVVRACWIYSIGRNNLGDDSISHQAYSAAFNDADGIVRAALSRMLFVNSYEREGMEYESLRKDSSALVRLVAWRNWLYSHNETTAFPEAARGLLAEGNPILRTAGLIAMYGSSRHRRMPGSSYSLQNTEPADAAIAQTGVDDAWLRMSIETIHPLFNADSAQQDDVFVEHALSGDRSRQMLAMAALLANVNCYGVPSVFPLSDTSRLSVLTQSERLLERLLGLAGCAFSQAQDAESTMIEALNSEDWLLREAALYSVSISTHPPSSLMQMAIEEKLDSTMLGERLLAADAICRKRSFDELHDLFICEAARAPESLTTQAIAREMVRATWHKDQAITNRRRQAAINSILSTDNPLFHLMAAEMYSFSADDLELRAQVMERAAPEIFLVCRRMRNMMPEGVTLAKAVENRLLSMCEEGDAVQRATAVRCILKEAAQHDKNVSWNNRLLITDFVRSPTGHALKLRLLNDLLRPQSSKTEIDVGLRLLATLIDDPDFKWGREGKKVRDPAMNALGLVGDRDHGSEAAQVLEKLLVLAHRTCVGSSESPTSWGSGWSAVLEADRKDGDEMRKDAKLIALIDKAEKWVMTSGDDDAKAGLLLARVQSYDPQAVKDATAEIEMMIRNGKLGLERLRQAFRVFSWRRDTLPRSLTSHMRDRLRERMDPPEIRQEIMNALYRADRDRAVIDILLDIAAEGQVDFDICYLPETWARWSKSFPNSKERPKPVKWQKYGVKLAKCIMEDKALPYKYRETAVKLLLECSDDVDDLLDDYVLEDNLPMRLRCAMASQIAVSLKSLKAFIDRFERLSFDLRMSITRLVVENSSLSDGEEWVIRALKDADLRREWHRMPRLRLELTPKLKAAYEQAAAEDSAFAEVYAAILKNWKSDQRMRQEQE